VRKHLAGEQTIGLYAINPMTQCLFRDLIVALRCVCL
jgi:hypothetical protein